MIKKRLLGAEHPFVLATRNLEAEILGNLGKYETALERVTALLPIHERVQGADHPNVIYTRELKDRILANIAQGGAPATPAD